MDNAKFKEFVSKIKKIKHIEIIVGVVAVILMIVIYTSVSAGSSTKDSQKPVSSITSSESVSDLEKRFSDIISNIDGVGRAEVMITYKSTTEKITANTTTTNNNTSSSTSGNTSNSTSITQAPVIVTNSGKSEPYVTKEILPEVLGVIIVAEGADNPVTKLAIMRAAQTALRINASNIEIFAMNKK